MVIWVYLILQIRILTAGKLFGYIITMWITTKEVANQMLKLRLTDNILHSRRLPSLHFVETTEQMEKCMILPQAV